MLHLRGSLYIMSQINNELRPQCIAQIWPAGVTMDDYALEAVVMPGSLEKFDGALRTYLEQPEGSVVWRAC